jgi:alpha-glucosidase
MSRPWWQDAVIYQVYPRSFADSDGDGIGDLRGIIERLPYLRSLGVDALWISPFFRSPMADFGYDISDHTAVDPIFGSDADAQALIDAAHAHGLRILVDIVLPHTSDQHPWFRAAAACRDAPTRDFYVWRDGHPDGGPPNNWAAGFPAGTSAWTWHARHRAVVPALPPAPGTRPRLVQPRGPRRAARRRALLARPRRRRRAARLDQPPRQGPRVPRQRRR